MVIQLEIKIACGYRQTCWAKTEYTVFEKLA